MHRNVSGVPLQALQRQQPAALPSLSEYLLVAVAVVRPRTKNTPIFSEDILRAVSIGEEYIPWRQIARVRLASMVRRPVVRRQRHGAASPLAQLLCGSTNELESLQTAPA